MERELETLFLYRRFQTVNKHGKYTNIRKEAFCSTRRDPFFIFLQDLVILFQLLFGV